MTITDLQSSIERATLVRGRHQSAARIKLASALHYHRHFNYPSIVQRAAAEAGQLTSFADLPRDFWADLPVCGEAMAVPEIRQAFDLSWAETERALSSPVTL